MKVIQQKHVDVVAQLIILLVIVMFFGVHRVKLNLIEIIKQQEIFL